MVMMLMALFLLAVLFLFGFISSSAAAADDVQTVRAWLTSSLFSTQKVKLSQSSQPLQTPTVTTQLNINKNKIRNDDELKSVFKTFDKNSDGYITKLELREAMKGAGMAMEESQIDEMVENMDENGDGLIDLIEFCASFPQDDVEDDDVGLREAFDVFDGNKDGVISGEELRMVLVSLGLKQGLKVRDCEEMIRKVDVDGDGMIDFSEFKKMMRNGGTLFASSTSSS